MIFDDICGLWFQSLMPQLLKQKKPWPRRQNLHWVGSRRHPLTTILQEGYLIQWRRLGDDSSKDRDSKKHYSIEHIRTRLPELHGLPRILSVEAIDSCWSTEKQHLLGKMNVVAENCGAADLVGEHAAPRWWQSTTNSAPTFWPCLLREM